MERQRLGPSMSNRYVFDADVVDMTRPHAALRKAALKAQPQDVVIDLNRTAVVVVDMQNDFGAPGGWFDTLGVDLAGVRAIYPRIRAVTDSARALDVPVIWLGFGVRPDRANLAPITRYPFSRVVAGDGWLLFRMYYGPEPSTDARSGCTTGTWMYQSRRRESFVMTLRPISVIG